MTLPLSRIGLITAMVITALPMFGDYYTNTLVVELAVDGHDRQPIEESAPERLLRAKGASLVLLLSAVLLVFMAYYLILTVRSSGRQVTPSE